MKKLLAALLLLSTLLVGCDDSLQGEYLNPNMTLSEMATEYRTDLPYEIYTCDYTLDGVYYAGSFEPQYVLDTFNSIVPIDISVKSDRIVCYCAFVDQCEDKTRNEWNTILQQQLNGEYVYDK